MTDIIKPTAPSSSDARDAGQARLKDTAAPTNSDVADGTTPPGEMDEWIARAEEQAAFEDRARPTSLFRALVREVRGLLKEGASDLLIYPDGAVFSTDRRTASIWIYGSRAGELDLKFPVRTRLSGHYVEVVPVGREFDLVIDRRSTRCCRATQVRRSPPAIPEPEFWLNANCHQLASALGGDPDEVVTIRCSGTSRKLEIGRKMIPLTPEVPSDPAISPFAGSATRHQLRAMLTSGKQDQVTFGVRRLVRGGTGLITHTRQTIDGSRCMVHRLVVLRRAEGGQ